MSMAGLSGEKLIWRRVCWMKTHYSPRSKHKRSKMRNQKKIRILRETRRKNWKKNLQPRWNMKKMKNKRKRIYR